MNFDDVKKLARHLPGVAESTSYGTRALKVDGKLFARLKEDGETLVLKVDLTSRDFLLRDAPKLFYLTDHYRDYPYVLLRLGAVTAPRLEELLQDAWRLAAPRKRLAQRPAATGSSRATPASPAPAAPRSTPARPARRQARRPRD